MSVNPFILMAGLYLVIDAIAVTALALEIAGAIPPVPGINWTRIHLLTIGVVTQAIAGILPVIVAQKLGGTPPGPRATWSIWLLINGGFALLLMSMPAGRGIVAAAGATAIFAGIVVLLAAIHRQHACPPVGARHGLRFFIAGPIFFLFGILLALSLLLNWPAPGGYAGVLESHVHANIWGFVAIVAAGILLDRVPALANRALRFPALVPTTSWLLVAGAAGLVAGPWLGSLPLIVVGLGLYVVGTVLLLVNLVGTVVGGRTFSPNLAHVLVAYVWMFVPAIAAPAAVLITGELPAGALERAAISGLVTGWLLQLAIGTLPGFVGAPAGAPGAPRGSWLSVASLNIGVLILWTAAFADPAAWAALNVAGYGLVVLGWLPPLFEIASRLIAAAPPAAPA